MKVFVTGGAGYIGRVLVPKMVERGYEVTVLDRNFLNPSETGNPFDHLGVKFYRDDIRYFDPSILRGYDAVVDLAALSNDPAGELDPIRTWDINYIGRSRVCRLSKKIGVGRYIVSSSTSVYGFRDEISNELTPPNPLTTYAEANVAIEKDTLTQKDKKFIPVALRFATAFGYSPRMRLDIAINAMTFSAVKFKRVRVMKDGQQYRPFVHVKDISNAIIMALEADDDVVSGEVFNVGSENLNVKLIDLAHIVERVTGIRDSVEWYGDPDRRSYRGSFEKIRTMLGYKTTVDIENGVKEIKEKIEDGTLEDKPEYHTVEYYKKLLDAKILIDSCGYSVVNKIL
ncbi:MAG: SDR family oxidoreductase [Candidatus Parvarchaeota archaeon]